MSAGLAVVFIILAVEAVLFLPLAWYLEQVLKSGTGVRRHLLFFLPSHRRHKQKSAQTNAAKHVSHHPFLMLMQKLAAFMAVSLKSRTGATSWHACASARMLEVQQ